MAVKCGKTLDMQSKQKPVFCLMGPTAVGKTSLAIELIQRFPFEIISVDSGMIYRGMDIGTAKPTTEQLKATPHRLIDICDPIQSYSAGQFRQDAIKEVEKIFAAGKVPLLVGGTMLYFRVLQQGISSLPQADRETRAAIAAQREELGIAGLYRRLQQVDPQTAAVIKPTDSQRIQRALEVQMLTGKKLSELKNSSLPQKLPYRVVNIALALEREEIKVRINERFKAMLQLGFMAEVEKLYKRGDLHLDLPAIRMVGYRQAWQCLAGQISYQEMLEQIPIVTRQLAKRQMTWLRSWSDVRWFDTKDKNMVDSVSKEIGLRLAESG